ncbi:MAG: hypothetical protein ACRCZF_26290 [Gemmataceae bacterium]
MDEAYQLSPDDLPVQKEPTLSKAPPTGRLYPCGQCGARMEYDANSRGLKCGYCNYKEEIVADINAEIVERDYRKYLDTDANFKANALIDGRSTQSRCTGCGAMVLLEDKVQTDTCPFCATHLENQPESAADAIPPESLLPFQVELRKARENFTAWLGSLWFAPSELKKIANLGQLAGIYLPYWTYDTMTYTSYSGERGDDYIDTEYYTETAPDGSSRQASRTVTRTRWYSVSGEVQHFFDDVLVAGTTSVPRDLLDGLEPWDLAKLEPFQPQFLSGFKTERYGVNLKEGFADCKQMIEPTIVGLIRRDIGGNHQRIREKQTKYSAITFKHLLLPVWVAVYRYHDQSFQILVNGVSGKVVGKRPWSTMKIARLVAGIILAIILVVIIVRLVKR